MSEWDAFEEGVEDGLNGLSPSRYGMRGDDFDSEAYRRGYRLGGRIRDQIAQLKPTEAAAPPLPRTPSRSENAALLAAAAVFIIAAVTILDWITPERVDPWRGLELLRGIEVDADRRPAAGDDQDARPARSGEEASESDGSAGSAPEAPPSPQTRLVKSDQFATASNPGFEAFANAYKSRFDLLNVDRLTPRAREYIARTQCYSASDRWVCRLGGTGFPFLNWAASDWRLEWRLSSAVNERGERLRVSSRLELEHPALAEGGIALGEGPAARTGVAIVCPEAGRVPQRRLNCSEFEMRVAFNLSNPARLDEFPSLFRTVGYDWIRRAQPPSLPYDAETFALASLYKITGKLYEGGTLESGDETIFSNDDMDRFRLGAAREAGYRVGNRSDYQLGMSRGACVLAHGTAPARVEPAAFTPDLPSMPRSFHIDGAPGVPCAMFINWRLQQLDGVTRDRLFAPERAFPDGYYSGHVRYPVTGDGFDPQLRQRVLALRGTAMALYLLGFETRFSEADQRIVGQWPRREVWSAD